MIQSLQIKNLLLKWKAGQIQRCEELFLGPFLLGKIQGVSNRGCIYLALKAFIQVTKCQHDNFVGEKKSQLFLLIRNTRENT